MRNLETTKEDQEKINNINVIGAEIIKVLNCENCGLPPTPDCEICNGHYLPKSEELDKETP